MRNKDKTCTSCVDCGVIVGKMVCLSTGTGRGFSWNDTLRHSCYRQRDCTCKHCGNKMKPFTHNIYLGEDSITKSVMICEACGTIHIPSPTKLKDYRDEYKEI